MTDEPPALRHPTGPLKPPGGIDAATAELGHELKATTAMFPVVPGLRPHTGDESPTGKRLAILTLTALGVVYGDIGTSPLYSLQECFGPHYGLAPTRDNVFGVLSMVVWALTLVVSVKYVSFILRADNRGEGGSFALLALIFPQRSRELPETTRRVRRQKVIVSLALFATALLYGDGIITPAMSVLSAVSGLNIVTPKLTDYILPITIVILIAVFAAQRFGTDRVGKTFGPLMLVWFSTIAVLGLMEIVHSPWILAAVNPWYALKFIITHRTLAFLVLGSVVLVITGGEALYADMGHFGKRPIRVAWLSFVFPALLLNYFGQGALLVRDPAAAANPFFLLAPKVLLIPLLVIATLAAVIASQAMISGAFSITRQGIQLGYIPRLEIVHTSKTEEGQIYIPEVNAFIAVGCIIIVLGFRSISALGAAYGIAVTGTMFITTLLFNVVMRLRFRWPPWKANLITALFLIVDTAFLSSNLLKVRSGGWVPLALGVGLFMLMLTWKRGRRLLIARLAEGSLSVDTFLESVEQSKVHRVAGTAVFMTGSGDGVPPVLLHHLKHNKVLHERVLFMSVRTSDIPETPPSERVRVMPLGQGFWRVIATYGFMQSPNVPQILEAVDQMGIRCKPMETSYFLGRERLIAIKGRSADDKIKFAHWRKVIFAIMARNARSATEFFGIPPNRVVELGTQIEF